MALPDELRERVRDAVMDTFREWGGQWNVSPVPPGTGGAPPDRWLLRVHSRPVVRATLGPDVVNAYLEDAKDPGAVSAWQAELRPTFEEAKAQAL
ncbi:MAG: hypothetical protein V3U38_06520 [Gemmatimonadota bacterium]